MDDEKDNEEPWREDRQKHRARHAQAFSSEENIRIALDGLRGEHSIAELCRREGISQGSYYKWPKDVMEAGKKRLAGDTARAANTDEVKELRREAKCPSSEFFGELRLYRNGGSGSISV